VKASEKHINKPEQKNPMEGKKVIFVNNDEDPVNADGIRGHLEAIGQSDYNAGFYEKIIKRILDICISLFGLILLSPILLGIIIAIKVDDSGPAFFAQKRIGRHKTYFKLYKFRSMKVNTPKNIPTHMLDDPDAYFTRIGKFLRAHSLDELPQLWNIFTGKMSVVGPRPALWNQDLLVSERDKYNANEVKPGLTGWAQLNGRDELEIEEKALLDGEYVKRIGFRIDCKCFFDSIHVVRKDDSIVEGRTGDAIKAQKKQG